LYLCPCALTLYAQTKVTVHQTLERLDMAESTLLIFTSDNGSEITGEVKPYDRVRLCQHCSMGLPQKNGAPVGVNRIKQKRA